MIGPEYYPGASEPWIHEAVSHVRDMYPTLPAMRVIQIMARWPCNCERCPLDHDHSETWRCEDYRCLRCDAIEAPQNPYAFGDPDGRR